SSNDFAVGLDPDTGQTVTIGPDQTNPVTASGAFAPMDCPEPPSLLLVGIAISLTYLLRELFLRPDWTAPRVFVDRTEKRSPCFRLSGRARMAPFGPRQCLP